MLRIGRASLIKAIKPNRRTRGLDIPDFTDYRAGESVRPILFTPAKPAPLEGVDLATYERDVDIVGAGGPTRGGSISGAMAQIADARIDAERFGLPAPLVSFLRDEKKITAFTGVQARTLQTMYANKDVAVAAPTGSGKTYALCIGVVAKILRNAPMKVMSTLMLMPSVELCVQVERWLREMWPFPRDERLVYRATPDRPMGKILEHLASRRLIHNGEMVAGPGTDARPYIVVATPETMYEFYQKRLESLKRREQRTHRRIDLRKHPPLPSIDTVVVDEVDEVLCPGRPSAPGNQLMTALCAATKYQAPVQLVFNSATLSATTVNHVRGFMRKSSLAFMSARIFEDEENAVDAAAAGVSRQQQQQQQQQHQQQLHGGGATIGGSGPTSNRVRCPENVRQTFYTADNVTEQRECIEHALRSTVHPSAFGTVRALAILPEAARADIFAEEVIAKLPRELSLRCVEGIRHGGRRGAVDGDGDGEQGIVYLCSGKTARGVDIPGLTHVFVLDRPATQLEYVHWVGRVGRMGAAGHAVVVMQRSAARHFSNFCDALDVPFRVQRRHDPVHVPHGEY